ncbi:hypothetical protein Slin15195_G130500 [Septoria linicola]|uniref:Uncharacterized protein n=1 Tax=Septoria linicola TaxID=215465 RepID=A0A9Q9EQE4_9PEZI|nr:hypothetical protein Slin14017_G122340 [Septoria linicola]USW59731.1 hypothetical protein Slin15195_G130500 [Septoria linicola]
MKTPRDESTYWDLPSDGKDKVHSAWVEWQAKTREKKKQLHQHQQQNEDEVISGRPSGTASIAFRPAVVNEVDFRPAAPSKGSNASRSSGSTINITEPACGTQRKKQKLMWTRRPAPAVSEPH